MSILGWICLIPLALLFVVVPAVFFMTTVIEFIKDIFDNY